MKRRDLIHHLKRSGCVLLRQGGRHTIFYNPAKRRSAPVPRHREIAHPLARKICKQLGIPEIDI